MKKTFIPALAILFFTACGDGKAKKEDHAVSPTAENKPAATSGDATQISVTITGGTHAGTYTASSGEPTCSMGLTGDKSFGNQYSVSGKGANEFSSLQLIVDDYEGAKSGTDKFYIKIAFGKRLEGDAYEINGSDNSMAGKKQGSGKLTITESGSDKTVNAEGKTSDGIEIKATLTCRQIVGGGK